ncbi:MAG: DUF4041 domain-containing protein [Clostridium sp.]
MGFLDIFKATENKRLKSEIEELNKRLVEAELRVAPELLEYEKLKAEIVIKEQEKKKLIEENENLRINKLEKIREIESKNNQIVDLDEKIYVNDFGIYKPRYDLETVEEYKLKIDNIIEKQKEMIKNNTTFNFNPNWTVNKSKSEGQKMSKNVGKQAVKSLNVEFEVLKQKVRYNNLKTIEDKLTKSFRTINKMNSLIGVEIADSYCMLKIEEMYLYFELEVKKKEEKERKQELARQVKEEAMVKKELEESKKNIIKDKNHYINELHRLEKSSKEDPENEVLKVEKKKIEEKLQEIDEKVKDIDYRQENQKAGYVYIISNEGAFGKDVYKIGMTRRLEPMERIKELSGASVPFMFNVHSLIFTENAPGLENELHKYFSDRRVNTVNNRKEFFKIENSSEIKNVIKEKCNETFGFIDNPIPEDYFPIEMLKVI